jgi:Uma2 family endonuclease
MRHARAASKLEIKIGGPFDDGQGGPGGWWIIFEPEIHLREDILVPDIAGWRRDLVPHLPSTAYCEIAPHWVCEILSPSTAGFDRVKKLPIYAREKVDYCWLIHPVEKTLEVYCRKENQWIALIAFSGNDMIRAAPFDAIEFDLGSLWLPD